jgi:tetratricopeptide (TPR) repeat protein
LGDFDASESSLERALDLAGDVPTVIAQASRYLADITLTIRGDADRAAALFDQALAAAHALGDPAVLSRTLLMAGWVPYWRNELDAARAMFDEALQVARSAERGDAWAEARALVGLASVTSPVGDEADALALGEEALAIGRESGQAFTEAVARGTVAGSLRRMGRSGEALGLVDGAIVVFRELGARWELASALGDRGDIHRVDGRLDDAEADLREAYRLCRDLKERALVTWTAAELSLILIARGDLTAARSLLDEPSARLAADEPGSLTSLLRAEAALAYAAGDDDVARTKAEAAIAAERGHHGTANPLAAQIWWTARLLGDQAAGGAEVVREARERLERHHWVQAFREPDLLTRPA